MIPPRLNVGLSLRKTKYFTGILPLTAFFKQFDAFETLQDVTFCGDGTCAFEATMLRHREPFLEMSRDLTSAAAFFNPSARIVQALQLVA